jgi:hypothetical protein
MDPESGSGFKGLDLDPESGSGFRRSDLDPERGLVPHGIIGNSDKWISFLK